MNDKTSIKLTLVSKQEAEALTQSFMGELYLKGNSIFIKYAEHIEGQEIRHLIRYSPNELKLTRRGLVESEQVYRLHEQTGGYYDNHMVHIKMETVTKQLTATDKEKRIIIGVPTALPFHLNFDYDLFVDGQPAGQFEIRLTIEEANV